jgi:DNA oxidative demethylase
MRVLVAPPGLAYVAGAVPESVAAAVEARLDSLPWEQVLIRGGVAKRVVVHYGRSYSYDAREVGADAPPLPSFLEPLLLVAAELAHVTPADLPEALVSRYPVGAAIGWHRDAPAFERVVGFSFGNPATLKLRRTYKTHRDLYETVLEPRSAYVLTGQARWTWQHSIPPAKAPRHSVTFRTLYRPGRTRAAAAQL